MTPSLQWDKVSALEQCDHRHLLFLATEIMECRFSIDPTKPWTAKQGVNDQLISFLKETAMDGTKLKGYQRKQFGKDVVSFCDGNKQMKGMATKLHQRLVAMDDHAQMERFKEIICSTPSTVQDEVCSNTVSNFKYLRAFWTRSHENFGIFKMVKIFGKSSKTLEI